MNRLSLRLVTLIALLPLWAHAAGPRVLVYPFDVFNAPEVAALAPGLQSMMASRIAARGYSVETTSAKELRDTDWGVRTTITHLGGVYSVDAALIAPGGQGEGTRTYETAKSPDAILPALEAIAARLKAALERDSAPLAAAPGFPASEPPKSETKPAQAAASTPPASPAPRPLAPEKTAGASAAEPAVRQPRTAPSDLNQTFQNPRAGPVVSGQGRSVAAADVDGDGNPEILLLADDSISAFRDQGGTLIRVWESPTPRGFTPLSLSVGDVDGNGVPEVFVAGMDGFTPASQALEWFGSALAPKGDRIHAFVRAVSVPGQKAAELLGSVGGMERNVFASGVRSFSWQGRGYELVGKAKLPRTAEGANLTKLALEPGRAPFTAVTSQVNRLVIYDERGDEVCESGDTVQGSMNVIIGQESFSGRSDEDIVRIQGKTVAWSAPGGDVHLFVPRNDSSFGRFFMRSPSYTNSQIVAFRWRERTLFPVGDSPKIQGFVADVDLIPARDQSPAVLYAVHVQNEGSFVGKKMKTKILAYDLPSGSKAP